MSGFELASRVCPAVRSPSACTRPPTCPPRSSWSGTASARRGCRGTRRPVSDPARPGHRPVFDRALGDNGRTPRPTTPAWARAELWNRSLQLTAPIRPDLPATEPRQPQLEDPPGRRRAYRKLTGRFSRRLCGGTSAAGAAGAVAHRGSSRCRWLPRRAAGRDTPGRACACPAPRGTCASPRPLGTRPVAGRSPLPLRGPRPPVGARLAL